QQQPELQLKFAYIAERESSSSHQYNSNQTKALCYYCSDPEHFIADCKKRRKETEIKVKLEIEIIETKVNLMTEITETDLEKEAKKDEQPEISENTIFEERKDEEKNQIINRLEAKVQYLEENFEKI
ncbi:13503_t:CDS:2, partial [Ambispora leptoticha]